MSLYRIIHMIDRGTIHFIRSQCYLHYNYIYIYRDHICRPTPTQLSMLYMVEWWMWSFMISCYCIVKEISCHSWITIYITSWLAALDRRAALPAPCIHPTRIWDHAIHCLYSLKVWITFYSKELTFWEKNCLAVINNGLYIGVPIDTYN